MGPSSLSRVSLPRKSRREPCAAGRKPVPRVRLCDDRASRPLVSGAKAFSFATESQRIPRHEPPPHDSRHAATPFQPVITFAAACSGFSILEAGGNAIDAGCAAGIALAVLQPDLVNVARHVALNHYLVSPTETYRRAYRRPRLRGRRRCRPIHLFMREHGAKIPDGVLRTVIPCRAWTPGSPRCAGTARCASPTSSRRRSGSRPRALPFIRCWPHRSPRTSMNIVAWQSNTAIFPCRTTGVPKAGRGNSCNPDLAKTLQFMADRDRAAGPDRIEGLCKPRIDAFYRGDIAQAIVKFQKEEGGYLSMDDPGGVSFRDLSRWCRRK